MQISPIKTKWHARRQQEDDVNFRFAPLEERERKRNESSRERERERQRERCLSFFMRADWEPARSKETMTTRQPTLATEPAFSQSEPDRRLGKG